MSRSVLGGQLIMSKRLAGPDGPTAEKRRLMPFIMALLVIFSLIAAACSSEDDNGSVEATDTEESGDTSGEDTDEEGTEEAATIRVPTDHDTIQGAVDAAAPGSLILIEPGVYHEAVDITTPNLTLRGLDRNEVILDGQFQLENGIRIVEADGVSVQNMTAHSYTYNGFFWTGVDGFHGSYLTAYRNGDYGIYAFDSVNGLLEHSYGGGSPDAGFYIGQCFPCNAVIDNVISEYNGLGYSGTNSGGNVIIINSTFRYNRAGIVPNSGSYELCYPERDTTLVGNTVYSNNQGDTDAIDVALLAMGNGILVAGGVNNTIERNLIFDHERTGIGLVPFPEEGASDVPPPVEADDMDCAEARELELPDPEDIPDLVLWQPRGNSVRGNEVSESGMADLAVGTIDADPAGLGNCFADNVFTSTAPQNLETLAPCDGEGEGDWTIGALDLIELMAAERPPKGDYKVQPVPGPQENMPNAETAPAAPAINMPPTVDLDAISVPTRPS